jgi:hypothetical protein
MSFRRVPPTGRRSGVEILRELGVLLDQRVPEQRLRSEMRRGAVCGTPSPRETVRLVQVGRLRALTKRQQAHPSSVRINDQDRTTLEIGRVLAKSAHDGSRYLGRKHSVRPQLDDA